MNGKEFDEFIEYICRSVLKWKDHPKQGKGRSKRDLINYQKIWNWFYETIARIEKSEHELNEIEEDFVSMTKYRGDLYRYHMDYDTKHPLHGIVESEYCVSWTKSEIPSVFYWTYDGVQYLRIKAITNETQYGIDLVGFSNFIQKHIYPNYTLGTPAILKEQEVVFPLMMSHIGEVKVVTR